MVIKRTTPTELFTWTKIDAGYLPEFILDQECPSVLAIPRRKYVPQLYEVGDYFIVPHYEIANEHDNPELVVDLTSADVYSEAWRLLQAAADLNPRMDGGTREEIEDLMRGHFAEVFRVNQDEVEVESYALNNEVVGIYQAKKDKLVLTIHFELTLFQFPYQKPTSLIECGFAVLDTRIVLGGRHRLESSRHLG